MLDKELNEISISDDKFIYFTFIKVGNRQKGRGRMGSAEQVWS